MGVSRAGADDGGVKLFFFAKKKLVSFCKVPSCSHGFDTTRSRFSWISIHGVVSLNMRELEDPEFKWGIGQARSSTPNGDRRQRQSSSCRSSDRHRQTPHQTLEKYFSLKLPVARTFEVCSHLITLSPWLPLRASPRHSRHASGQTRWQEMGCCAARHASAIGLVGLLWAGACLRLAFTRRFRSSIN